MRDNELYDMVHTDPEQCTNSNEQEIIENWSNQANNCVELVNEMKWNG